METVEASSHGKSPSIITILIWAHGGERPLEEFKDKNVRIVYLAGRVGSVYLGAPDELYKIDNLFIDLSREKQAQLTDVAKIKKTTVSKLMKELYAEFPQANTCKNIPNFSFDVEGQARPQSTFDFLQKYISHGSYAENYRAVVKRMKATTDPSVKFSVMDAETDQTHRLHTPVINKVYEFFDLSERPITDFGIKVLDVCNYEGPMKIGDDLTTSKKSYNAEFKDRFFRKDNKTPIIYLRDIVGYLHHIGFDIINIIDMSCRYCAEMNEELRERITQSEHEENEHIDRGFGRPKKERTMKRKKERRDRKDRKDRRDRRDKELRRTKTKRRRRE